MAAFKDPVPSALVTESFDKDKVLLFELVQLEASLSRDKKL